jgi:ABC-type glutathione transport system ATPase component
MKKYGGPIAYLIVECLFFFAILVHVDSGSLLPRWLQLIRPPSREASTIPAGRVDAKDVREETEAVDTSSKDLLRVLHVSKTFDQVSPKAVDDVSFGVSQDTVFAMLGPNGAGKF